jgi:hypothetical protein
MNPNIGTVMNNNEIEQLAQAMNDMTPEELQTLTAIVGPELMAKMQAALAQRDTAFHEAGEEIVLGAERHLHGDD